MKNEDEKIKRLFTRNVSEIINKNHLKQALKSGKKLRVKLGIDPTGPKIHLGRAVALWKLREFQDLGHQIILIIGDFTGLVGDASDKKSARPILTEEQLKNNMKEYPQQIGKILDFNKVEFHYNSEWLSKLSLKDTIYLASLFTIHQMINRRNFKERFESGKQLRLHELLYPLLQGYDSVAVKADIELGGTDQLFNLKAGRQIQEFYSQKPQDIFLLEMLPGLDGEKMSTTLSNVINITDEPNDMYGKIMSMKDELIPEYFLRCTLLGDREISKIISGIKNKSIDPFKAKGDLAFEIVSLYHDKNSAEKAKEYFKKTFQEKELPKNILEIHIKKGERLIEILLKEKIIFSKGVLRRLIKERAVEFNGTVLNDVRYEMKSSGVIRVGKKRFLKVTIK